MLNYGFFFLLYMATALQRTSTYCSVTIILLLLVKFSALLLLMAPKMLSSWTGGIYKYP